VVTTPTPDSSSALIYAYQLVPSVVQVAHADGTTYSTGRAYDVLTRDQKMQVTRAAEIYQSDEAVYVFFVKPGTQTAKTPVTCLVIPNGQWRGLVLSFDTMVAEMCELVKRRHFGLWISRWNSFYGPANHLQQAETRGNDDDDDDDDDGFELTLDQLDQIPVEDLLASVERQRRAAAPPVEHLALPRTTDSAPQPDPAPSAPQPEPSAPQPEASEPEAQPEVK